MATEQILKSVKKDIDNIIVAEPELSLDKLFAALREKYNFNFDASQFVATASDDPQNPDWAILDRRYNDTQLDILEDVYVNDWTANECVQKKTHFVWGRHGKTVLDTKVEYMKDTEKRAALTVIYQNEKYTNTKKAIDTLNCDENIDLYEKGQNATNSAFVYGRAVIQIIRKNVSRQELESDYVTITDSNEQNLNTDNMPIALKLLNSKRLGKTRVDMRTNKIISIEYLDVRKLDDNGQVREATTEERMLKAEDLIIVINPDGNVSTNAQFTGVSRLESIINVSMVKRIIMNQNLKEAAKTHYAGILVAKFPTETETSTMGAWITNAAKAAGRWFAHRLNVAVQHFKVDTDLDKYSALVDLLDAAIIRAIGLPRSLIGYEQYSNYANLEQVLVAYKSGELDFWRTWVKGWLQKYWLNPLFQELLPKGNSTSNESPRPQDEPTNPKPNEDYQDGEAETEEPLPVINDEDVKITYEFQDISFLPKKDIIEGLKMLKDMGVALTDEMILRAAGYDEMVEEVMQNKLKVEAQKQKEAEDRIQKLQDENNFIKRMSPGLNQNPFATNNQSDATAAASDKMMDSVMAKYDQLTDEKIKTLKALQNKLEMLN